MYPVRQHLGINSCTASTIVHEKYTRRGRTPKHAPQARWLRESIVFGTRRCRSRYVAEVLNDPLVSGETECAENAAGRRESR